MPITLLTGPANAGKARAVMDAVRRHSAHGEEPLLIVPTRADSERYRRELAGEHATLGVRVERFDGLIAEAVIRVGKARSLLSGAGRRRLLSWLLEQSGEDPTPGLVRSVCDFVAELQAQRVSPARLERALAAWTVTGGGGAHVHAVGRAFTEYRRLLERLGRLDAEQRAVLALDELRRTPALWRGMPVLLYGFDDFTRLQLDAIETLGVIVDAQVTVALTYERGRVAFAGRGATFQTLAALARVHHQLEPLTAYYAPASREALNHLERSLFEPNAAPAKRPAPGHAVRLLEGGGERAELELVAGEILELLTSGMAPEEIALVARAGVGGSQSLELLEEVFAAAGVPIALQRHRPFAHSGIGRALLGLLRCASDGGGELADLLAWLRAPALLAIPELADTLELSCRRAGIERAEDARALWEEHHWPLEAIDRLRDAAAQGPVPLIARASRELERLFCTPHRARADVLATDEQAEARAFVAGQRALAELADLARIAREAAPGECGALARELELVELLAGERPASGRVAVLDPLALRARRVRALFVCSMQEGTFPARGVAPPLLGEEERRDLAETSGLVLGHRLGASDGGPSLAAERYLFYAAVSRPEELLVLSWHLADDDGEPTPRSLFVDDVCDLFDEQLLRARARRPLGALDVPAVPPNGEEHASANAAFTPAPAPLRDELLLEELRARAWSPSSLELWLRCPVRWLIERMLRAQTAEPEPEPLARGALAHAVLRDTFERLRQRTGSSRLDSEHLALALELLAAAIADSEADFPLSVAPERGIAALRRLQADLERYLRFAASEASELEPRELEVGFGFGSRDEHTGASEGADALPALDLGDGVALRGRIDRIDVGDRNVAVVYDYKGRSAPPAAKWLAEGHLQMPLYMLAVERLLGMSAVGGFYQPLAGPDLRPRGVLDRDADVAVASMSVDHREHGELRELLDGALTLAREVASEARRGQLEPRPRSCTLQGRCAYPTICRCER